MNERRSLLRDLNYADYPPPRRLFAVVSWGCAATNWLARALNECPGVLCLHAANFYWELFADARSLSGPEYMRIVGMLGTAEIAAGEVHGIARTDIPSIRQEFGDRFRSVVLVRDPLPRLRSQLALFKRYLDAQAWDVTYVDGKFPAAVDALPTGSYEERLFIHGVNMLNAIVEELEVPPIVRMEDVTTQPAALLALVEHLTAGVIKPSTAWADSVMSIAATNRHSQGEQLILAPWQRRVFGTVLEKSAIQAYRDLGYSIDASLERLGITL